MSKVLPTKGNLAWEYNPFRNYRIDSPKYYFRNKFFTKEELELELDPTGNTKIPTDESIKTWDSFRYPTLENGIHDYEDDPIFYDVNQLVDFDTDELTFDVNHPVDVLPQYSYDGSVNLIINDGKNQPRLINSRFSPLGRGLYQIVDRKGDNDTNIYDQGSQFQSDTSLYKTYVGIPELEFINVYQNGNLPIGNYHFYFRYVDADGNETDFVAESGMVSIFKGTNLSSVHTGFRDENSFKSVKFILSNVDPAYQYVNVYYTRSTADINENSVVTAHKINQKFLVNNSLVCQIYITGNEDTTEISVEEINVKYQIAENVQTQEQCQNMLFFGNIQDQVIDYKELSDLSLRFMARPDTSLEYNPVPHDYNNVISNTYSDPKFIYGYTGYQNHEIYRFGIVYLMSNGTLSPVFNVRGAFFNDYDQSYNNFNIYNTVDGQEVRNYITYNEDTGIIYKSSESEGETRDVDSTESLENVYGVVRIESSENSEINKVIGIRIEIDDKDRLFQEFSKYDIKGYFFVRQKRIPLRLCQALTIGVDGESNTPLLYTDNTINVNSDSKNKISEDTFYITERFLTDSKVLTHTLEDRLYCVKTSNVNKYGAICPEYDVNSPYLNTLFCGDEYVIEQVTSSIPLSQDQGENRHLYINNYSYLNYDSRPCSHIRVIGVEDNVKLVEVGNKLFSARAGEAEEAFRYEYISQELKSSDANNLLRGSYGPYLGFDGYKYPGTLVNIYIPDYSSMNKQELFKIRINDKSPYYAISERYDITQAPSEDQILYRGDTYICTFTHRFNRNFQDPSAPINHRIVDENCWKDNYEVSDGVVKTENFENINLGDVNAIKIGMWITFQVVSSYNLNIRSLDDSNADEMALTGHARGFYPYYGMSVDGSYKTPEALCYNKGFGKSLSERYNYEVPDVPAIKNDFTNRIAYSDIHVNDAFKNGFRVFRSTHYRDYPKTYGQITKLVEFRGNLICVFEHGVALIPVNERAVAGEGAGGNVYINTSNVLPENPKIISDTFGSQWKDSVIKTPMGVYGVDTIGKKIWRTNGESFECISDFKVQEFLNQNISLGERELEPIIGVRNVKTHYNRYKQDVMFTFYDNLYGFEEKVWNLCFNELQQKWITFYSWVPSYSENIYNQYFSFDRNTSKWITKLGVSHSDNDFSDGVVLSNNVIPNDSKSGDQVGNLSLANRTLPEGEGVNTTIYYTLERDNYKNYKNFQIKYEVYTIENGTKEYTGEILTLDQVKNGVDKLYDSNLYLTTDASNLCSELYVRGNNQEISTLETITAKEGKWEKLSEKLYRVYENDSHSKYTDYDTDVHRCVEKKTTLEVTLNFYPWLNNCVINSNYPIYKDDRGRRINLSTIDKDRRLNGDKVVTLLNIRANILVTYNGETPSLAEAYTSGFKNGTEVNAGYYESVVAVIPQYNMQFLTTDFWKHGQAGIIDIADKIYPTYWYGKQHPFEFEFVVADNPSAHKIFDNLQIISNNAEPESFHYEIVGDCYNFAKDKKNMYIRQEATKELYQYNGCDVTYDHEYSDLDSEHRPLLDSDGNKIPGFYDRSTLMPLYYSRQDTINEIEDSYHLKDDVPTKDFSALAGGEIVHYKTLDEYRIWNHAKAVDMQTKGRLRGNMQYNEDQWLVQINPINIVYKNEKDWTDIYQDLITEYKPDKPDKIERSRELSNKIPIELGQSPIPDQVLEKGDITYDWDNPTESDIPENSLDRAIVSWGNLETKNEEVKLKDKWIKIRIRYTGNKLAIITAIRTLYSVSYS